MYTAKTEVVISLFEVGNSHSAPLPPWWFEVKLNVMLFLVLNNHWNEVLASGPLHVGGASLRIILSRDSSKPACDHNNLNLAGSCRYISSLRTEKNSEWLSGEGFERQTSTKHYQERLGTSKGKCVNICVQILVSKYVLCVVPY